MADVVLDANVLVGALDENDSLHVRATALVNRLLDAGHATVLLDFLVAEAISVICRRANERKTSPPDLALAIARIREWRDANEIEYQSRHFERLLGVVLDIIEETGFVRRDHPRVDVSHRPPTRKPPPKRPKTHLPRFCHAP